MIKKVRNKVSQLGFLNKKVLLGGFVVALLIALPVTLFLVNQLQDTRQQAASTGDQTNFFLEIVPNANVSTTVSPAQVLKGREFSVKVKFDARAHRVLSLVSQISYDQTKFTLNSVDKTGNGFDTVNFNTNIAPGQVRLLAEADPNAPLDANGILIATLKFTASSVSTGPGTVFFTDQTSVLGRPVGATTGNIPLTYDSQPSTYSVVDALPVIPNTSVPPTNTGIPPGTTIPTVTTLSHSTPGSLNKFNSAVNPNNNTVDVIYRWGRENRGTTATACQQHGNLVNGPTGLSGSTVIQPNGTAFGTLPSGTKIYWCASIKIRSTGIMYYGNVLNFTTGTSNPPATVTNVPNTVTQVPATATNVPATATNVPGTTIVATNTSVPPQTITLSSTTARLEITGLKLPGVGTTIASDNHNPIASARTQPGHIYLYDAATGAHMEADYPTNFTYSNGTYSGSAIISNIPFNTGYVVKVKFPNTLQKNMGSVVPVAGQTTSLSLPIGAELVSGDIDTSLNTNYVDLSDYTRFLACFRNQAACTASQKALSDFDADGEVGLEDFNILLTVFAIRPGD